MGTSIQVGEGDGMYRMHIHVEEEKQNLPHEYISKIGLWTREARENLCAQMPSYSLAEVKPGQIAVVVVSPGMAYRGFLPAWEQPASLKVDRR